jgi:hypothetical protein
VNKLELSKLLTLVSAFDSRTVGPDTVEAWYPIMEPIDAIAAADAVRAHFESSDKYLMPAHIIGLVKSKRRQLLPSDVSFYCEHHWPVGECVKCGEGYEAD